MKTSIKHRKTLLIWIAFLSLSLFGFTAYAQDSLAVESEIVIAESTPVVVEEVASVVSTINSLDTVWVLLAAMLVFFMHPGFALVESGFTRSKNTTNILMKNFVTFMVGTVLFWFIGFGVMFGEGFFAGAPNFGSLDFYEDSNVPKQAFFIFQTVFAATAATIVSGAMAERVKFHVFFFYTMIITSIIYPISGHWTWGGGWLSELGFHDFAGSTIVHSVGGWIALIGAWLLGPRIGKYSKDGKSKAIPGHNLSMAALGVFVLWLGWFGFNPGSQLAADGFENSIAVSHVFMTTYLSGAAGGIGAVLISWIKYKKPSLSLTLNGVLAGLVGITAGTDVVSPVGALIIGLICGIIMVYSVEFIDKVLRIDDPVGASSVHGVVGLVGTLCVGLFSTTDGLFYGGGFHQLGIQALGAVTIGLWAAAVGFILFKTIDLVHGLRVPARVEEEGLDIYEHGESAYN